MVDHIFFALSGAKLRKFFSPPAGPLEVSPACSPRAAVLARVARLIMVDIRSQWVTPLRHPINISIRQIQSTAKLSSTTDRVCYDRGVKVYRFLAETITTDRVCYDRGVKVYPFLAETITTDRVCDDRGVKVIPLFG